MPTDTRSKITGLGIIKENFEVTSYIFDDPATNYQGVIGLDFFEKMKFCIDLDANEISLHEK